MTYLNLLLLLVLLPALALTAFVRPTSRDWLRVGGLAACAYLWTAPWDNYLVASGVWYYNPGRVGGLNLGWVPLEEYLFFGLQAWLTGVWALAAGRWLAQRNATLAFTTSVTAAWVILGFLPLQALTAAGGAASDLTPLPFGNANYLVLILAWALPVIAAQLWLGWDILRAQWRTWVLGVAAPTLYLAAVDAVALGAGIWAISPAQSLNVSVLGLVPVEEALFFLVTNLMLVQGLLLFSSPLARVRALAVLRR